MVSERVSFRVSYALTDKAKLRTVVNNRRRLFIQQGFFTCAKIMA